MNKVNIEDFISYSYLSSLAVSPDGKKAGFALVKGDKDNDSYAGDLWLMDLETSESRPLTSSHEDKRFIFWDDNTMVFTAQRDKKLKELLDAKETWTAFYKLNLNGGEAQEWFRINLPVQGYEKVDEKTMLLSVAYRADGYNWFEMKSEEDKKKFKEESDSHKDYEMFDEAPFWANGQGLINQKRSRLYLLDLETLEYTPISDPTANASSSHIKDGQLLYISNPMKDVRVVASSLRQVDLKTKKETILVPDHQYGVSWAFFVNGKVIAALSDFKEWGYHSHASLYEIDSKGNKTKLVHFDNTFGASLGSDCLQAFGTAVKEHNNKIYFSCTDENNGCMKCFDEKGNITVLSGYHGGIEGFDFAGEDIILIGLRNQKLQEIYRLHDQKETQLSHFNTEYHNNTSVSEIETIRFTSDGIEHEGFVIKPVGFDPNKTYPGILEIHGGPKGTFGPVINHEMQVFANNGYFVFYANPRGSDSRGNQFADIRGRFGKEDFDDLMTFTDSVLAQYPQLDKDRLGVTGSSYGGYMSNWIITQTDRFKAAIPEASISNYITKILCTDIGFTYNADNCAANPWTNLDLVWEQSPLKYADKVKTPTLFIHSDQDYRCWIAEPIQMFTALKLHGVETKILLFHGEHHGLPIFGKPSHRIKRIQSMLEWFDSHCK